ncbi:CRISPR-associated protein [uncultured Clostridium sp.]|nr:CRISPR-associated protein [uncultured Clostridium sp.]
MKTYKHLEVREIAAEIPELKKRAAQYPYMIAHMYSDIQCGENVHDEINWDELVELRAFDEKGELHIYEQNGGLKAVEITETEDCKEDTVVKYYPVRKAVCASAKRCVLAVKEYLEDDEDGQAVVVYTRPFGLEAKAE